MATADNIERIARDVTPATRIASAVHDYVQTHMNVGQGDIGVPDGARTSVKRASIHESRPNGGDFHLEQVQPW
jgi:hypothetical protein